MHWKDHQLGDQVAKYIRRIHRIEFFFLVKKKYLCSTASIEIGFSVLIAIILLIRCEMIVRIT